MSEEDASYKSIDVKSSGSPIVAGLITTAFVDQGLSVWIVPKNPECISVSFEASKAEEALSILKHLRENPPKKEERNTIRLYE